jgi:cobalt-zinc-cadmium efflux system outer membrane protein
MLAYQVENAPFPGGAAVEGMARENMTTATLPLAPLYQRGARVRQADAVVRAAEADARAERQSVALDAARAYYRAAVATVSADAAENLAQWLDSVVAYNHARVRQGAAAEADLIRSQLERDRAVADAGIEAAELARARADLAVFLGDPAATTNVFAVALDDAPLGLPSGVSARAQGDGPAAVDRRPDVVAARERVAAAGAGTALEQRMIVRELGATVGVKQSAGTNSMIAGVSLPLPLFDQNRGELARARAERDAATFELAAQERTARAEVVGAEAAARILTERAAALAARDSSGGAAYLARADEARRIALGAYREGAVSLLQVLDAARAWGEARVAYYRTLYAQHEAVLALLVARGDDLAVALPRLTPAPSGAPTR